VLGFELDRETPFTRDEVHWDYAVRRTDPAHGKIDVDLFIVPRPFIDPVIEAARHAGLEPIGVEIETGADEPGLIRLGTQKRWQWLRSQRSLVALAGAAGILAVVAIAIPFIRQQWSLASANAAVNSLTAQAQEAASLRQSVDQLMTTQDFLNKERSRNGSALNALAATTRLVPDDSHLTALSLRASRLTVTGVSPSAAKLVDLLAQSKEFREPAFDSPVVQDDTGSLEAFTISATLAPAGGS
jgi:general secretion pathway protein L